MCDIFICRVWPCPYYVQLTIEHNISITVISFNSEIYVKSVSLPSKTERKKYLVAQIVIWWNAFSSELIKPIHSLWSLTHFVTFWDLGRYCNRWERDKNTFQRQLYLVGVFYAIKQLSPGWVGMATVLAGFSYPSTPCHFCLYVGARTSICW